MGSNHSKFGQRISRLTHRRNHERRVVPNLQPGSNDDLLQEQLNPNAQQNESASNNRNGSNVEHLPALPRQSTPELQNRTVQETPGRSTGDLQINPENRLPENLSHNVARAFVDDEGPSAETNNRAIHQVRTANSPSLNPVAPQQSIPEPQQSQLNRRQEPVQNNANPNDGDNPGEMTYNQREIQANNVALYTGTIHQYYTEHGMFEIETLLQHLKDTLQRSNAVTIGSNAITIGSQAAEPVPLNIAHETRRTREMFGRRGMFRIRNHSANLQSLKVSDLFPAAKRNASEEAQMRCNNQHAIDAYIRKHGNVVGVSGIAGIGKSTLGKQHMKLSVEILADRNNNGFSFHPVLRNFDFNREISVLEFLLRSSDPSWEHSPPSDRELLKIISNSPNVYITMDALDEARLENLSLEVPTIGLFDKAMPDVIFKNLLAGNILPNAFKMLISRPGAYHDLHPDYKPHFTVKVLGLSEESLELLFQRLCVNQQECEKLKNILAVNPLAKSLCSVPVFAKLIVPYALRQNASQQVFSIADVFASFVVDCFRSPRFCGNREEFFKLSELALRGMLDGKLIFSLYDLEQSHIDLKCLDDFISTQVTLNEFNMRIMDGDKQYYFSHLTWQEFFAALQLMYMVPLEDFSAMLQRMRNDEWEMVFRFLFGLLNQQVKRKLINLFPHLAQVDITPKVELLKRHTLLMAQRYSLESPNDFPVQLGTLFDCDSHLAWTDFRNRPDDTRLLRLCCLALESKDASITNAVATSLPDMILISRVLLPTDVSSLIHVLRNITNRTIKINIGAFYEPATFIGDGLKIFLEGILHTRHKIRKFHIKEANFDNHLVNLIADRVPKMLEISLQSCDLTSQHLTVIERSLQRHPTKVTTFVLRGNKMTEQSIQVVAHCVGKTECLHLQDCEVTANHMQLLSESIQRNPIKWMSVGSNYLGAEGIDHLARCIHNIHGVSARDCGFTGSHLRSLADAVAVMQQRINLLYLGENNIGVEGLNYLSRCVHNVEQLELNESNIIGHHLELLSAAIARMDHSIKSLTLNENNIGQEGMNFLATCAHNIEMLWLYDCNIVGANLEQFTRAAAGMPQSMKWLDLGCNYLGSAGMNFLSRCIHRIKMFEVHWCDLQGADLRPLTRAIAQMDQPMKLLNVSYNGLRDHGAYLLSRCLHNIITLDVTECNFTPIGVQLIIDALGQLDQEQGCTVVGLGNQ